ncbi:hypothetical protein D7I46_01425 [Lactococcus allomyrinae]|uniref:Uncharacterized protein n=2 Tax=Lactococcus allomyrinae TaxID=2419773 RepID=A0A387BG92_9LACT|nr:hypothetical protein D7I46_01425 [Lactococcus allomyrinae]
MKKTLQQELFYSIKSKMVLGIALATIILVLIGAFQGVMTFNGAKSLVDMDKKNDIHFQENIKKGYSSRLDSQGGLEVDNLSAYDFAQLNTSAQQVSASSLPEFLFKTYGLTFFSILAFIIGVLISSYDYKFETYQRRLSRSSWKEIITGKIAVIIVLILGVYILAFAFSVTIGRILPFITHVHVSNFNFSRFWASLLMTGISFMLGLALALVGFAVNMVVRRVVAVIVTFIVYVAVIPSLGKFDWKNIILNLYSHFGTRLNVEQLPFTTLPISLVISLFLLYVGVILVICGVIFSKRTRFML